EKQFHTTVAQTEKSRPTMPFHLRQNSMSKEFPGARQISARELARPSFRDGSKVARTTVLAELMPRDGLNPQTRMFVVCSAPESGQAISGIQSLDRRPFLVEGKSQKAISQHDTPLTIEQVRELLNRNK